MVASLIHPKNYENMKKRKKWRKMKKKTEIWNVFIIFEIKISKIRVVPMRMTRHILIQSTKVPKLWIYYLLTVKITPCSLLVLVSFELNRIWFELKRNLNQFLCFCFHLFVFMWMANARTFVSIHNFSFFYVENKRTVRHIFVKHSSEPETKQNNFLCADEMSPMEY